MKLDPLRLARFLKGTWLLLLIAALIALVGALLVLVVIGEVRVDAPLMGLLPIAGIVPLFATGGLVASIVVRRGCVPLFMLVASALLLASMIGWTVVLTARLAYDAEWNATLAELCATGSIAAVMLVVPAYLLSSPDRRVLLVTARWGVTASVLLAGTALLLLMWSKAFERHGAILLVALALGIVATVLGTIALLVMRWILRIIARRPAQSLPQRPVLELVCPHCGAEQSLAAGPGRCAKCKAPFVIEIEEPRCACGYLLYRLQGEACPECGRAHVAPGAGGGTSRPFKESLTLGSNAEIRRTGEQ